MRTQRCKVHKTGKDDNSEVFDVDSIATVNLGAEQALDTWVSGRAIKQRTDQKAVR